MIHSLVKGVLVPCRMIFLLSFTKTSPAEKVTSQPASQNWPMESRGLEANSGTMCPVFASVGKSGKSISAVCVDSIVAPLGFVIRMGVVATRMLCTGVPRGKKWEVQPVSPMEANVVLLLHLGFRGGPTYELKDTCCITGAIFFLLGPGSQPFQVMARCARTNGFMMRSLPSIILSAVASFLWPSPFLLQVLLQ